MLEHQRANRRKAPHRHQQLLQRRHSREVGIHTNWLRAKDEYVISTSGTATPCIFQILVKPLVNLLWVAGFVFVFGSLVALWPDAREQRRLVARLALART